MTRAKPTSDPAETFRELCRQAMSRAKADPLAERRAAARLARAVADLGGPHARQHLRTAAIVEAEADALASVTVSADSLAALDGLDLSADVCGWSAVDALAGLG